jgi:hypothetical protein
MNATFKVALLVAAVAAIFAFALPAASQTVTDQSDSGQAATTLTGIEVTNADSLRDDALAADGSLDSVLGGVALHIVVEYANTLRSLLLMAPDGALALHLGEVAPRPLLGSAESTRQHALFTPPAGLAAQVGALLRRIELGYAESSADWALAYPAVLLADIVPPQVSIPVGKGAQVEWITDEFTTTEVRYGVNRNNLEQSLRDTVFKRTHKVQLNGMGPAITIYCQIKSTDQSGNTRITPVYQVSGTRYVYMPAIQRKGEAPGGQ